MAIVPPADGTSVPIVAPEEDPKPNVKDESIGISETSLPEDDRTLMRTLAEAVPSGATLVAAFQDPRTNELTLTYSVTPEVHEPTVAAEGARSSLGKVLSATAAVVRVAKGGKLTYVATIERARLAETETATWRQANTASDAWLRHVLQQEWGTPSLNTPATGETGGTATPAPTGP
ncbi:hypothetical protein EON79_17475 [bacterium]|nr:MAG: hypothetical protein EON79_17475 [bacterium]